MKTWALEHPFLTAFLVLCALLAAESVLVAWANAIRAIFTK